MLLFAASGAPPTDCTESSNGKSGALRGAEKKKLPATLGAFRIKKEREREREEKKKYKKRLEEVSVTPSPLQPKLQT